MIKTMRARSITFTADHSVGADHVPDVVVAHQAAPLFSLAIQKITERHGRGRDDIDAQRLGQARRHILPRGGSAPLGGPLDASH